VRYDTKTYIGLHVKYLLFLSDFNETWIFSTVFSKITQTSTFMKIRVVGAELFPRGQKDGRTDLTKLTVAFSNYANAPTKMVFTLIFIEVLRRKKTAFLHTSTRYLVLLLISNFQLHTQCRDFTFDDTVLKYRGSKLSYNFRPKTNLI